MKSTSINNVRENLVMFETHRSFILLSKVYFRKQTYTILFHY